MLHKFTEENTIIYDRATDAEGHGKQTSDGKGGGDKNELSKQFRNNAEYQPEAFEDHKPFVSLCDIDNRNRIDFADICTHVLENPTRGQKVPPNKPRKQVKKKDKSILKTHYNMRKEGIAQFEGLKMIANGFEKGSGGGIKSMYNFRFERALKDKFAYCQLDCNCDGYYTNFSNKQLKKDIQDQETLGTCGQSWRFLMIIVGTLANGYIKSAPLPCVTARAAHVTAVTDRCQALTPVPYGLASVPLSSPMTKHRFCHESESLVQALIMRQVACHTSSQYLPRIQHTVLIN